MIVVWLFPMLTNQSSAGRSSSRQQKSGQNIAVLPGWGERTYLGDYWFWARYDHPLTLSRKKLKDREVDIYLCTHHNRRPDECPKTHIIYHEVLYPYVLEQIRALARSMKRRKVNSPICRYADIQEVTPEILQEVVDKLLVGHVPYKAKTGKVVQIQWRFN